MFFLHACLLEQCLALPDTSPALLRLIAFSGARIVHKAQSP
jgi:hypothetical protein